MEGNAKAMRETVELCIKQMSDAICDKDFGDDIVYLVGCMKICIEYMKAALSAPPRNCDRFADELDAQLAFLNEVWLITIDRETMTEQDTYEKWTDEMRTRYGRWLLARVTEKDGEAK